jgi:hypothetical protein
MGKPTSSSVLAAVGLDSDEATRVRNSCAFRVPQDLDAALSRYVALLGNPFATESIVAPPEDLSGSIKHKFILMLWPHLHWVVHERPDGRSWGVGFENQVAMSPRNFSPAMVRSGLWTRTALERLSQSHQLHDGWDERVVVRFNFQGECFEGTFCLGLLQEWRAVALERST